MPLKSFPKTFGLGELKKGYFPHYFNKECHKNYVGCIPAKKCTNFKRKSQRVLTITGLTRHP